MSKVLVPVAPALSVTVSCTVTVPAAVVFSVTVAPVLADRLARLAPAVNVQA